MITAELLSLVIAAHMCIKVTLIEVFTIAVLIWADNHRTKGLVHDHMLCQPLFLCE
ncbi:hypothetical protein DPMN_114603 [Dreissena polymorpha]|uniref:Uncharacterized protein n=1 Tax=Dreissena polymorpha TaxID=45954 RepID=A0A9D4KJP2_DREPO|nr:hypothetical protein DPMN_114603 [Dreissena polymorpha]